LNLNQIKIEYVISFSDVLFAFSITFMALSIQIPTFSSNISESELTRRLGQLLIPDSLHSELHGSRHVLDLNEIVQNSIAEYERNQVVRSNANIQIKYTFYVGKVFVEVDRTRIAQVISNLLSNAFKFTKEGSIIVNIELDQRNSRATVSVKDSGKGIDPEVVPRLFEKFASKSFQGTGLGLFISRSIVEGHGGRIWAVNNNKVVDGQMGATFYFTLPLVKGQADQHNPGEG
jgi:signal transduction histidine kinase